MSADPRTANSAPRSGSDGPESAWNPGVGASRRPNGSQAPQTGADGFRDEPEGREVVRPYRILVTGSRAWPTPETVWNALDAIALRHYERPIIVVHGACRTGADAHARRWVREANDITQPVIEEPHRAEDFGPWPRCGPIRNRHMVSLGADLALAFIGPCASSRCRRTDPHPSHGASGCADLAEQAGIPVRRYTA